MQELKRGFDSYDNSAPPGVVSFYATWCSDCRRFVPTLEQVKTQMGDRIKVVKVDSDRYAKVGTEYGVQALPTTLIFIGGELASRIKGGIEAPKLIDHIHKAINS